MSESSDLAALRSLRIGCVGSGGTGKSTFAAHLRDAHGVPLVTEGVREWLAARGRPGLDELDAAEVAALMWDVLDHRDRGSLQPAFVADRTAIDSICFARSLGGAVPDLDAFVARAEAIAARIDVFVFFPFRAEYLVDDGVRKRSPVFQLAMSSALFAELQRLGLLSRVHVYQHHRPADWNLAAAIQVAAAPPPEAEGRLGLFDPTGTNPRRVR